jgi:hypothetical protein
MHVEADQESIGIFPDRSGREHAAAGRLFFSVLRALIGEEPGRVLLSQVVDSRSASVSNPLPLFSESMVNALIPTGRADWKVVEPESARGYRVYWDICDHFVTLINPNPEDASFADTVCKAVERERDRLGVRITTSWDSPPNSE